MKGRFTTSDGLSLAFEDEGDGLPLLCLPGLTRNARDFDDLAPHLPKGIRMIRLTSRGRDGSDYAKDPAEYTVPVEARDALELLVHLGIARAVFLGTSRGGMISMLIGATAPDRVAGICLNDIGPEIDPVGLGRIMDYVGIAPSAETYDEMAEILQTGLGQDFPDVSLARWRGLAERWFSDTGSGLGLRYDPRLREAMAAGDGAAPPDLWPLFDALNGIPLAAIRGENSDILSDEAFQKMKARRPDMIAATIPDRGHVPFLDEQPSLDALRHLIAKVDA